MIPITWKNLSYQPTQEDRMFIHTKKPILDKIMLMYISELVFQHCTPYSRTINHQKAQVSSCKILSFLYPWPLKRWFISNKDEETKGYNVPC